MATSMLTRTLEHWDCMMHGNSLKGFVYGPALGQGAQGWIDRAGVYVLYRDDYDTPVGATSPTATTPTEIKNYPTAPFPLTASTNYTFYLRAIGRGGAIEQNTVLGQTLLMDGAGVPVTATPNQPHDLRVYPQAGGKFLVTWQYESAGEQSAVSVFNLYHSPAGAIAYDTPLVSTTDKFYLTTGYANGLTVKFGVRAEDADGNEESNTTIVSATADATGPSDLAAPTVTAGGEM